TPSAWQPMGCWPKEGTSRTSVPSEYPVYRRLSTLKAIAHRIASKTITHIRHMNDHESPRMSLPDNRRSRSWSLVVVLATLSLPLLIGGCSAMSRNRHDIDHPANPLPDQQAMAQVIDPARQIAKVAGLQDFTGGFHWESCNDQGDPPYRGLVEMSFQWPMDESKGYPTEVDPNTYFDKLAATMAAHGWNNGPPPGWHSYGRVINKDGVVAVMTQDPASGRGAIDVSGECRNMTNHRHNGTVMGFEITDQLRQG
ncbi:hypothetical protein, partial [Mycobacterium xenopi]